MNDMIEMLERMVEESEVSHRECAALKVMLEQVRYYIDFKAKSGDLYAANIKSQILKQVSHVA